MKVIDQYVSNRVSLYNGDSIEILKGLPDHCIHYAIFSPPFSSLYTYSNSDRDLGNSTGDDQFYQHFLFLVKQFYFFVRIELVKFVVVFATTCKVINSPHSTLISRTTTVSKKVV